MGYSNFLANDAWIHRMLKWIRYSRKGKYENLLGKEKYDNVFSANFDVCESCELIIISKCSKIKIKKLRTNISKEEQSFKLRETATTHMSGGEIKLERDVIISTLYEICSSFSHHDLWTSDDLSLSKYRLVYS